MRPSSGWRLALSAVTAAAVVTSTAGAVSQPATADTVRVPKAATLQLKPIAWIPCRDGFQCAKVHVPLDYDDPNGPTTSLSVIRQPAMSKQRIGALFMNPGGPGASAVDLVRGIAPFLPLELRGRFDIVGFDPRGILRSNALRCFTTFRQALSNLPPFAFPVTTAQENVQIASDKRLANACRTHAGPILDHMSTADTARDMDLLRQAMGDSTLSYIGFSYGSELGQTYANLFPDRVRALVIDGVLDPRAWAGNGPTGTSVPVGTRLRSAKGAQKTLAEFFRLCNAAGRHCALSGHARARFHAVAGQLRAQPIHFEGGKFRYSDLIGITLGAMYSPPSWPDLANFLRDLEAAAAQAKLTKDIGAVRSDLGLTAVKQQRYPNFVEGGQGVICSDGDNPDGYRGYRTSADNAERDFGYFGRIWNWIGSACAVWPGSVGQDRYTGPWTARTANPVLVVGNYFDPATRYAGAVTASRLLPNSRLLSYAGWGHTAFMGGHYCVDAAVTSYLVTTQPPAPGSVCQPEGSPFGAIQAKASPAAKAILAAVMPQAVRRAIDRQR